MHIFTTGRCFFWIFYFSFPRRFNNQRRRKANEVRGDTYRWAFAANMSHEYGRLRVLAAGILRPCAACPIRSRKGGAFAAGAAYASAANEHGAIIADPDAMRGPLH